MNAFGVLDLLCTLKDADMAERNTKNEKQKLHRKNTIYPELYSSRNNPLVGRSYGGIEEKRNRKRSANK